MEPIKHTLLGSEHFELFPIWTWYEGSLHEPEDLVRPVPDIESEWKTLSTIFVSADFLTVGGTMLRGYVVLQLGGDVFAIDLWLNGKSVGFNRGLRDLAGPDIESLKLVCGASDSIFPIKYFLRSNDLSVSEGLFDFADSSASES